MQYMTLEQKQQFAKDLRQLADILETDVAVDHASIDWAVDDGTEEVRIETFEESHVQRMQARPLLAKYNFELSFMPMTKEWRRPEDQPKPKAKKSKNRKGRK